jgi:hypothetical protein
MAKNESYAFQAGKARAYAATNNHRGTLNVNPSIVDKEEFASEIGEFWRGGKVGIKKANDEQANN